MEKDRQSMTRGIRVLDTKKTRTNLARKFSQLRRQAQSPEQIWSLTGETPHHWVEGGKVGIIGSKGTSSRTGRVSVGRPVLKTPGPFEAPATKESCRNADGGGRVVSTFEGLDLPTPSLFMVGSGNKHEGYHKMCWNLCANLQVVKQQREEAEGPLRRTNLTSCQKGYGESPVLPRGGGRRRASNASPTTNTSARSAGTKGRALMSGS